MPSTSKPQKQWVVPNASLTLVILNAPAICPGCGALLGPGEGAVQYWAGFRCKKCANAVWGNYINAMSQIPEEWTNAAAAKNWRKKYHIDVISIPYKDRESYEGWYVIDLRKSMRNPYRDKSLRKLTGLDDAVVQYIERCATSMKRLQALYSNFQLRQKIAFMCHGGKHRSVMAAEWTANKLREEGFSVSVAHRGLK